jgi:partitioning defective protein 3
MILIRLFDFSEMLLVTNESGGPLGLTAIPDQENGGLLVQSVEPESRAEKGRLRRGDRILEMNGINLMELPESSVQEQLRKCIASSELRLRVIRARPDTQKDRQRAEMFEAEEKSGLNSKVAHVSPTRKVPGTMTTSSLQAANTRKLGRRIELSLKKGAQGLGFSVTTRDNPAGGHCPIYIKNILPKGAAVEDGRLKPGDRLLEVDNVPMTGKSQSEVVNILRATQPGATVKIVVSRQQDIAEVDEREIGAETQPKQPPPPVLPMKNVMKSPSAPNILDMHDKLEKQEALDSIKMRIKKFNTSTTSSTDQNGNIFPWRNREILTLNIPVHDTEKAGLGVSVKGKTGQTTPNSSISGPINSSTKNDGDLGIFIKSVLHGGAASRDGRLKMNDQLLSVNGISLLGQSNAEAMDTLRRAMLQTGGKNPGVIVLKIARRASSRPSSTVIENGEQNVVDSSGTNSSEQSGSTVIYLSPASQTDKNSNLIQSNTSPMTPQENVKRWSNPVIDRLTGGTGMGTRPSSLMQCPGGLRNDSYYMATNDTWSPMNNLNGSNAVLIEEDPEPTSPTSIASLRPDLQHQMSTSTPTSADITYASQLSLENPAHDAFSRDAIGRRSMSEKHHAAMDAKETGTYQRNKKMREERDRSQHHSSVESLTNVNSNRIGSMKASRHKSDLRSEAMDRVGELGPSLGMKKSSSLESLQTMVQEIQMSDEPRGPNALRAPRGRGREEVLRAAVERPEPRKHWLLEDGTDNDGGFSNRGTLQSSNNASKNKDRNQKKPGLLKGIGSMFRFGKHRKDVYPAAQTEVITDLSSWSNDTTAKSATLGPQVSSPSSISTQSKPSVAQHQREPSHERQLSGSSGPPSYHPPPPTNGNLPNGHAGSKITQNDAFNHRYSHYVNYDELQMQIR